MGKRGRPAQGSARGRAATTPRGNIAPRSTDGKSGGAYAEPAEHLDRMVPGGGSLGDVFVPVLVAVELASGGLPVELQQAFGDLAGAAGADLAVVHLDQRDELGGGAGEERLVGQVQVRAHQRLLDDLVTLVAGQRDD